MNFKIPHRKVFSRANRTRLKLRFVLKVVYIFYICLNRMSHKTYDVTYIEIGFQLSTCIKCKIFSAQSVFSIKVKMLLKLIQLTWFLVTDVNSYKHLIINTQKIYIFIYWDASNFHLYRYLRAILGYLQNSRKI